VVGWVLKSHETMQSNTTTDDANAVRVLLDPAVTFSRREVGGKTSYVAHHRSVGKYFRFGAAERRIAELLDGKRSMTEVVQQAKNDGIDWKPTEVAEFVSRLVAGKLASVAGQFDSKADSSLAHRSSPTESSAAKTVPPWSARVPRLLSLMISQRIPLLDGQPFATKLKRRIGPCFDSRGRIAWSLLVLGGLGIVYSNWQDFASELRRVFDPGMWLILIAMWCVAKILHETGHAVAARHHGVRVGKIGIMFFFLAPLAYVDVTDAWKLTSRWKRVQIALAGVYLELAAAAMAAWAWWLLPDGAMKHLAAQFFLIAGPASLLVNANPLLRLDGYYVLSDLTEIPNLRMHGRNQLAAELEWRFFRIPKPRPMLSGWRAPFATCHAVCSVVFQVFWMAGLIIAVSMWARGLGVLLATAALLLWVAVPLSHWVRKIWSLEPADGRFFLNQKRKRMIAYLALAMMLMQYLGSSASPFDRRIPVIVQFHNEQIARAGSDAFVRRVFVHRGQRVEKGSILMELEDRPLQLRRDELSDDLQLAELRIIQLRRRGELAAASAVIESADSLRSQLAELDDQLSKLQVVAQRGGWALGGRLEDCVGRFVHRGEELLRVSDPHEKELWAAVGENEMQAYQEAAKRQQTVRVRLRGGTLINATPAPLRPRATRRLPHPALAATAGGPIAVEPGGDGEHQIQSVRPLLQSITVLDPLTSVDVHVGQLGTLTISDNRSLIHRLVESMTADLH
jgi:putative peptide zinc metalloprotease protein